MCTICGLNKGDFDITSCRQQLVQICECCKDKWIKEQERKYEELNKGEAS